MDIDIRLPGFCVSNYSDDGYDITMKLGVSRIDRTCPICKKNDYKNITTETSKKCVFRDLDYMGMHCKLEVMQPRFFCKNCNITYFMELKGFIKTPMMTERLYNKIIEQSYRLPNAEIARLHGLSEKMVRSAFKRHIKVESINWKPMVPNVLGIEDIVLSKIKCSAFVEMNAGGKHRLIEITPGRTKEILVQHLEKLQYNSPNRVSPEVTIINFNKTHKSSIKEVFDDDTIIAIPEYHVRNKIVAAVYNAYDTIYDSWLNSFEDKEKEAKIKQWKKAKIKRSLFSVDEKKLTKEERDILEAAYDLCPNLELIYQCKEELISMYGETRREDAEEVYKYWKKGLSKGKEFAPFHSLKDTIQEWYDEVFNYFDVGGFSIAYINRMKSEIKKKVNALGKSFSFEVVRAKMLYNNAGTEKAKYAHPRAEIHEKVDPETNIRDFVIAYYDSQYSSSLERGSGVNIIKLISSIETATQLSDI